LKSLMPCQGFTESAWGEKVGAHACNIKEKKKKKRGGRRFEFYAKKMRKKKN